MYKMLEIRIRKLTLSLKNDMLESKNSELQIEIE